MFSRSIDGMDSVSLSFNALNRFRSILKTEEGIPDEIIQAIEEQIIPALEFIDHWEPSDQQIKDNTIAPIWVD